MAKKTRTELSTLAINTNLPDNTTELITPTTERAQLTDERESVVNYKDDLGGVPNAGKFLTVAADGESLTMVDEPQGDIQGAGVDGQITYWDGTKTVTSDAMLLIDTTNKKLRIVIPAANTGGGISLNAVSASASSSLTFLNNGVTYAQLYYDNSTGNLRLASDGDVEINPSGTLSVDSGATFGGDVGIGTDSPDSLLHLASSFPEIRLEDSDYGTNHYSSIDGNGGSGVLTLSADSSNAAANSAMIFKVDGSEKMRITSGGAIEIKGSSTTTNAQGFITNDNSIFTIGSSVSASVDKPLALQVGGTNRLTISSGGVVSIPNGVVFNNNSVTGDKTNVTLNDYEEGTYTATATPSTGTITLRSDANTLTYTKIGRMVTVTGYCIVDTVSSPTGIISINLPFNPASGVTFYSAPSVAFNAVVSSALNEFWCQLVPNQIKIYRSTGTSVSSTSAQQMQTDTDFRVSATYFI